MVKAIASNGRRRPPKRSLRVPSSTCASRARSRRVQPCRIRARSIASTLTDHRPATLTLKVI